MPMNPAKAFGIALKRLRTANGLTQEALAHEAGLSLTSLARIETAVQEPKIGTVLNLAKAMKMSGAELVAEVERVKRAASAYEVS